MAWHEPIRSTYDGLHGGLQSAIMVVLIIALGYLVLKILQSYLHHVFDRIEALDNTLQGFVERLIGIGGWLIIIGAVLSSLGVNLSSMLGGLAIGGFVIGFALKDTLGNLAAGVMLLVYRPFNVGDVITVDGHTGEVQRLGMALTTILLADGQIVTNPNGAVLGGALVNHSRNPLRRADVLVGIAYNDDIGAATKSILEAVNKDPRVLAEPAPSVRITGLGPSSVDLQVRPWVKNADYYQTKADLNGIVKGAIEAAGCSIPFPQQDVYVHEVKRGA